MFKNHLGHMGLQGVHMISVEMSWVNLCFSHFFLWIHNMILHFYINGTRTKCECPGARAQGKVSELIGQGQWSGGQGQGLKAQRSRCEEARAW